MSMSRKKEKAAAQKKETTRQLIGINDISDYGLKTSRGICPLKMRMEIRLRNGTSFLYSSWCRSF